MLIDTAQFVTRRLGQGERLPADKTALVIIDMMRQFCDPRWLAGGDTDKESYLAGRIAAVVPSIRLALDAFRAAEALVAHVVNARWTHDARDVVPYQRGRDYGLFDEPRMAVIDELAPLPGEVVVRKVASSAFTGTGLDFILRNARIENVVLSGTWGSACVFYSLIQSRELGFENVWLEDGILYPSETSRHLFPALVGSSWAKLASAAEVVDAIGAVAPATER